MLRRKESSESVKPLLSKPTSRRRLLASGDMQYCRGELTGISTGTDPVGLSELEAGAQQETWGIQADPSSRSSWYEQTLRQREQGSWEIRKEKAEGCAMKYWNLWLFQHMLSVCSRADYIKVVSKQ